MHRVGPAVVLCAIGFTAACHWARPVEYGLPPGVSASFGPRELDTSLRYAKTFCSVLSTEFAGGSWKSCDAYVRMAAPYPPEALDDIPRDWTLLRIGGFGAQCMARTATAFEDAAKHLADAHHLESHHIEVGAFDSSEQNAVKIRDFVAGQERSKKFIVLAHSKGAADMLVAFASYPGELAQIKAVITVAGAVGGSWLVDRLARLNEQILRDLGLPSCLPDARARTAGEPNAIDSMRREVRQKFLADHEPSAPLAFSISAVSTKAQTSRILQPLWDRVIPYAREQDSHIVERESIVPWGTFLGRALGDHWAVAMPFDPNPKVSADALEVIDRNRFPRAALIEAAVRIAAGELASTGN